MEYKFEKLEGLKIKSINDFRKGLSIPYNSVARAIESENLDFVLISGKKYVVMNLLAEIFLRKYKITNWYPISYKKNYKKL